MTTTVQPPGPGAPPAEPAGAGTSYHASRRRQRTLTGVIARIVLILLSVLFLVPLYWMIATALKSDTELSQFPPTLWPKDPDWGVFADAVNAFPFWRMFTNTTVVTVGGTVLATVSSYVVAYGFSCIEWRGREKVFYLVLATLFVPFPLAIIPMFDLFAAIGWVNTLFPLIIPNMFASAFYIFLLRQFLLTAAKENIDAARIDGASEWQICWKIVFPVARPALIAVAIFAAVGAWNDFLGPLIYLQDTSVQTLSIGLASFRSQTDTTYNQLMAASLLTVLPLIILFVIFQRYFIRGLNVGGFR